MISENILEKDVCKVCFFLKKNCWFKYVKKSLQVLKYKVYRWKFMVLIKKKITDIVLEIESL